MRRLLLPALAALALVLCACPRAPRRPVNLLVLSVDTLRADALGAAGYEAARTPHVDALAAGGTYFTNAVTTVPRTTPALGSLMTGLWPYRHGSREVGDAIVDVPTLAETLRKKGWKTLAVSANSSAGPGEGLDRGFDEFRTHEDLIELYDKELYRDLTDVGPDKMGWAEAVNREGLKLLEGAGEPWFLWLFYFDPHLMYRPPAPWQDVHAERCWQLYEHYTKNREVAGEVFVDLDGVASHALEDCRRLYDAEVAYVDDRIGALLDELEATGRLEDTLIVFTADHGENFGEGGLFFEHGDNAHEAGLAVPLIFNGPGVARGRRDDGVVSLVDVMPTVLSLLGLSSSEDVPEVDGTDLARRLAADEPAAAAPRSRVVFAESATSLWNESIDQLVTGRDWWRRCLNGERFTLCEIPRSEPGVYRLYDHVEDPRLRHDVAAQHPEVVETLLRAWQNWPPDSARQRVARTERFKLVQYPRLEGGFEARLYDLEEDPGESVDVREKHPEVYEHLLAELKRWGSHIPDAPKREYDPEVEEKLRALGYVK